MRFGVVFIFFLGSSLVYGYRPTMRSLSASIRRDCRRQIKISDEDLENMRKAILNEDNDIQKCYIRCVLRSLNFMDETGQITPGRGLATIPPEMVSLLKPSIDVCSSVDGEDSCDKAMTMYRCIHREFPKIIKFL